MADPHQMSLYRLIVEIRRAFNELAAAGDGVSAPLGLTAAERAVLEHLVGDGAATVPDIARQKSVSRQHIQKLADSLVAKGLAGFRENPAHRRSQYVEATAEGATRFRELARTEGVILAGIAPGLAAHDIEAAIACIRALRAALSAAIRDQAKSGV